MSPGGEQPVIVVKIAWPDLYGPIVAGGELPCNLDGVQEKARVLSVERLDDDTSAVELELPDDSTIASLIGASIRNGDVSIGGSR